MLNDMKTETVVNGIIKWLTQLAKEFEAEGVETVKEITSDTAPGILIKSQILVSELLSLQEILKIDIPNKCYPFQNPKTHQQLSIKEAAEIIKKRANYAK